MPLALDGETTRAIAKALNDRGLAPPRGGVLAIAANQRLLARIELRNRIGSPSIRKVARPWSGTSLHRPAWPALHG
jgi:hypothetical protein